MIIKKKRNRKKGWTIYCSFFFCTLAKKAANAALDGTKPVKLDKKDKLKQVKIQEDNRLKKAK